MSSRPELRLDWCSHEAAKYAVEKWHYSRTMPVGKAVLIGAWEGNSFIGVVIFSRGASPHLGHAYGLSQTEICELTRVALSQHSTAVSRIIAVAIRLFSRLCPGIRMIVSFADSNEGHCGGIYQAGNWIYSGLTSSKCDFIAPNGKRYRDRQITASGVVKQFGKNVKTFKTSECVPVELMGKHRYLMPLDDEMRQRIEPLRKPYPKRERSAENGTPGIQSGGGGVNPTRSLQVTGGKEE